MLGSVLDAVLRLLHPVCPFVTETLWPHVCDVRSGSIEGVDLPPSQLVALAAWPSVAGTLADPQIVETFERADMSVGGVRTIRSEQQVRPRAVARFLIETDGYVQSLAGIATVTAEPAPGGASPLVFEGEQFSLSDMVDAADADAERARLGKKLDELGNQIGGLNGRLSNKGYVDNAPAHLVRETRDQLAAVQADLAATQAAIDAL